MGEVDPFRPHGIFLTEILLCMTKMLDVIYLLSSIAVVSFSDSRYLNSGITQKVQIFVNTYYTNITMSIISFISY